MTAPLNSPRTPPYKLAGVVMLVIAVVIVAVVAYPAGLLPQPVEGTGAWWLVRLEWVAVLSVVTAFELVVLWWQRRFFAAPLPMLGTPLNRRWGEVVMLAGAAMVSLGTVIFHDPGACDRVLRELGDEDAAKAAFRAAVVDGQVLPAARDAVDNPALRLVITDAETIATRTDEWDPGTETSREHRVAAALADEQQAVLATAQARLDELIGLDGPKEQIAVWRTEIQIDQLLAAQGVEASATNENHMVLEGPPGTAKTTFARIVAEILFGLGKIARPELVEVTEEDLVVGFVSQTAQRMKDVCEDALGGVLFIDEAYRLVPEYEGHSFGKDAINTLLKYMEDFRDQLVVIVAGYPKEMRRFMAANPGLASRFHFTLTFDSYTPDEIVAIGRHVAEREKIAIADDAWPLLHAEAARLRRTAVPAGTALDVAGNGRYARKVVIACKRERARRLHTVAPQDLAELARTDPSMLTVSADDMARALASALSSGAGAVDAV